MMSKQRVIDLIPEYKHRWMEYQFTPVDGFFYRLHASMKDYSLSNPHQGLDFVLFFIDVKVYNLQDLYDRA